MPEPGQPLPPNGLTLSVVVALYNAQDTISAAIMSALSQRDDLEVIVVDDCSSDGSFDEVLRLVRNHADGGRVRLLKQDVNSGAAAARNAGVRAARGRYVSFLDSDDVYLPNFASTLLSAIEKTGSQIAVGSVVHVRADGRATVRQPAVTGTMSGIEAARLCLRDQISPFTCDKVIDRSLFEGVEFPEGLVNEDFLTNPVLAARSKKVVVVDAAVYNYQVRGESVTWTATTRTAELDSSMSFLRDHLLTQGDDPKTVRAIAAADVLLTLLTGQRALLNDPRSPVVKECRLRLARLGLRSAFGLPAKTAVASVLLVLLPRLYRRVYRARVDRLYGGI